MCMISETSLNAHNVPWWLYLVLANTSIAYIEYSYRVGAYNTFLEALPMLILPILLGQFGLFYGFRYAESLFVASAVFTLINCLFRVVVVQYIGETMNIVNWMGVALLATSVILLKWK